MKVFASVPYKKASTNDIANASGISKSMIFHYFGNKKELYLYLINFSIEKLTKEVNDSNFLLENDFFERIKLITTAKISVLKSQPYLLDFLLSVLKENNITFKSEIDDLIKMSPTVVSAFAFNDLDKTKFKSNVKPELVFNLIKFYTEAYINNIEVNSLDNIDSSLFEYYETLDMLKRNFYKNV